jgi:hypothetical protein
MTAAFLLSILLLVLLVCPSVYSVSEKDKKKSWKLVPGDLGITNQTLYLRRLPHKNPLHTCYEVKCVGQCNDVVCVGTKCQFMEPEKKAKVVEHKFCYPALIIAGHPKCGTSAVFSMLTRVPGSKSPPMKEWCPYRPPVPELWSYIQTMIAYGNVKETDIIIGGCLDLESMIEIYHQLREPQTYFIFMVRDYADFLWAAYNFWCIQHLDGSGCKEGGWAQPGWWRTPRHFDFVVNLDRETGMQKHRFITEHLCRDGATYYTHRIESLQVASENKTIVIGDADLEENPEKVWRRVMSTIGARPEQLEPNLGDFKDVRINSQLNKGEKKKTSLDSYQPGVYPNSKFQPILPETREVLNQCWYDDCKRVSALTGYQFDACKGPKLPNPWQ